MCSGYGGLDLAAEHVLDAVTVWLADNALAPRCVLAERWPGVPNLGDITLVDWRAVEPVDVVTAGYPCQPFALSGRRRGATDERHLWPHIAEAVRVLRPRLTILENVAGHRSLGFDRVLGDLAALGFDAEWASLRAADVGAPHGRERVFIIARDPDQPPADYRREKLPRRARLRADETAGLWGPRPRYGVGDPVERWRGHAAAIERWAAEVGRPAPDPLVTGPNGGPVLSAWFSEWFVGLPEGWINDVQGVTREQAIEMCGNGVVPQQAVAAIVACLDAFELAPV